MRPRPDIDPTSHRRPAGARGTPAATSPAGVATSPSAGYRSLVASGFASHEAGNLTALLSGLRPAQHAWSVAEINRLHFLLFRVERDRIEP